VPYKCSRNLDWNSKEVSGKRYCGRGDTGGSVCKASVDTTVRRVEMGSPVTALLTAYCLGSGGNGHLPIVSVDNWPFRDDVGIRLLSPKPTEADEKTFRRREWGKWPFA
jgi:hypothetical protein